MTHPDETPGDRCLCGAATPCSCVPPALAEGSVGPPRQDDFRTVLTRTLHRLVGQLHVCRFWLIAGAHLLIFAAVFWGAFLLRFDFAAFDPYTAELLWSNLPWVVALQLLSFYVLGHFDGWWSYVTFADLVAMIRAYLFSWFLVVVVNNFALTEKIPRLVLILDCVLGLLVLGAVRASWRLFREHFRPIFDRKESRWALLVGADFSSGILAHQIQSNGKLPYRIRGFLSTDGASAGSRLGQIPILGKVEDVAAVALRCGATDVLVTAGMLPGPRLRGLMEHCEEAGLHLKIIRPVEDRLNGDHRIPIRDIEINDLLRREPVQLDMEIIGALIENRTVLVTGAGGSIGSEICRQVLKFNPRAMVLLGNGENPIFAIERELRARGTATLLHACIGDVTDGDRLRQIFEQYRPEVVFHAAAHKHVPLMELNVGAAIKNNVLGTQCLADMAHQFGVLKFVFISTDKAVHPSSVMGATKQIAERYVHALSQESATQFSVVRFGNVLGSNGSVVPVFQEQIRCGGPITITDPRMTRFFMTIPEATQLVLQAAAMGRGGEIFVLEMGEPVRIVDLAHDLIRLSGLPEHAIEIMFTGVRPGEKLFEELYFDDEQTLPTTHPKLRAAYHRLYSLAEVRAAIAQLKQSIQAPTAVLRAKLHEIVPEYVTPSADAARPGQPPQQSQGMELPIHPTLMTISPLDRDQCEQ
jgi:FlaA1/EpsC-like NDP-sugar epimerase